MCKTIFEPRVNKLLQTIWHTARGVNLPITNQNYTGKMYLFSLSPENFTTGSLPLSDQIFGNKAVWKSPMHRDAFHVTLLQTLMKSHQSIKGLNLSATHPFIYCSILKFQQINDHNRQGRRQIPNLLEKRI